MLLEAVTVGLLAAVAYKAYGGELWKATGSITDNLNAKLDNGYQYRDETYTTDIDLAHPDTKNNSVFMQDPVAQDRGIFGTFRQYIQTLPGVTPVAQISRNTNLIL